MQLSKAEAKVIVGNTWSGKRFEDKFFLSALAVLGISRRQFASLKGECHSLERRQPRFVLSTPTGSGKRR